MKKYNLKEIENKIFTIRGLQVMIDSDLADMYQVSTRRLNEQVKRNIKRFPKDFMFQLSKEEWNNLKSQNAISSWGGRRIPPYVFTEHGISSLSGVSKSEIAININISIIRAFVNMRKLMINSAGIFQRIDKIELKQIEAEHKFEKIFNIIENKSNDYEQGIFYNGQIFDAYIFISQLIKSAKSSLILIDNYIDESVLELFSKRDENVNLKIYTKNITNTLKLDLENIILNTQKIETQKFNKAHDRFLIIDNNEIYHIGASLKDLGKKWFAFSKMKIDVFNLKSQLPDFNINK